MVLLGSNWRVELKGAREAQRKTDENIKALAGGPVLRAFRDATLIGVRTARREAKVDRGLWRASVVPFVELQGTRIEAGWGSNLEYGPFADLDTKPHWPPIDAIAEWVHRKKLAGSYSLKTRRRLAPKYVWNGKVRSGGKMGQAYEDYQVAWLIARKIARKGTKGDHALEKGFDQNLDKIVDRIVRGVDEALR